MTLEQYLVIAIGALTGAVATLFLWFKVQFSTVEGKLTDCEDDREKLWAKLAGIEEGKKDKTERFLTPPIRPDKRRKRRR